MVYILTRILEMEVTYEPVVREKTEKYKILSMGIQKGKYDGSVEAYNKLLNRDSPSS